MDAVDKFRIVFYPPSIPATVLFIVGLVCTVVTLAFLGARIYLHLFGVRTTGKIVESRVKERRNDNREFGNDGWTSTHKLTIEYSGPDGGRRTVKGWDVSSRKTGESGVHFNRGEEVPVRYWKAWPGLAMYYTLPWIYFAPVLALPFALMFLYGGTKLCYKDLRIRNHLNGIEWTPEEHDSYRRVALECEHKVKLDKITDDPAIYERMGDANFAIAQLEAAIDAYGNVLRLEPGRKDIHLKRAKAEWLVGRNRNALRDWLASR